MFCSNCGKSLRPVDKECPHCHANLGEDRFYGNDYTSSQARVPAEQLNQTPIGGMLTYTRTNYMSFDNQPESDVYSNTTYRPLLSDAEAAAAEAEARRADEEAEQAAAEEPVAEEIPEEAFPTEDIPEEEIPADEIPEEEIPEEELPAQEAPAAAEEIPDFEPLVVEECEIIEEEPAQAGHAAAEEEEQPAEDAPKAPGEMIFNPDGSINPEDVPDLETVPKAAISPRVRSYMEELERMEQKQAAGSGTSLRMPAFLQNLRRKSAPIEEEMPQAEDIPGSEYAAAEEDGYSEESEYAEEDEYAAEEGEYSEEEEYVAEEGEYAEEEEYVPEEGEYPAEEGEYSEEEEYVPEEGEYAAEEGEYVAEEDEFDAYEDEDASDEEQAPRFSLNIDFKTLLENRILKISVAAVLIVAVLIAGISWLNFITTKRAKIVDVNYDAYTRGIEILTQNISEEYRTEMQEICLTNTSYASSSFAEDMAELNALMPAEPAANDELFITTLTIIQDAIAEAIKADANAELTGTPDASSELRWQAIANAVDKLTNATAAGELTVLTMDLESVVAPTPTPSPTPVVNTYVTLTNGMNNNLDVVKMQNRLINLGFLTGTADGDFGKGTEAAVKAFQRAAGLTADGVATPAMQEVLYSDDAPRNNASAEATAAPSDPAAQ